MQVKKAQTESDIEKCWDVIYALRPHLDKNIFLETVKSMMLEGYCLAFIEDEASGKAVAAIGYRYLNFLFNGKHFYIDDLTTLPEAREKGYASALLSFVHEEAEKNGYKCVTLDSGTHRHDAHRLYFKNHYAIVGYHFSKSIK